MKIVITYKGKFDNISPIDATTKLSITTQRKSGLDGESVIHIIESVIENVDHIAATVGVIYAIVKDKKDAKVTVGKTKVSEPITEESLLEAFKEEN